VQEPNHVVLLRVAVYGFIAFCAILGFIDVAMFVSSLFAPAE
jgi:hypothetical protein